RSFEPGRARFGIQRYRGSVARGIRYAAAAVRRRFGPTMGAGAATLSFALHVRAGAAFAKVWRASDSDQWAYPRALAGKSLGADMGKCVPDIGLAGTQQRIRPDGIAQS